MVTLEMLSKDDGSSSTDVKEGLSGEGDIRETFEDVAAGLAASAITWAGSEDPAGETWDSGITGFFVRVRVSPAIQWCESQYQYQGRQREYNETYEDA